MNWSDFTAAAAADELKVSDITIRRAIKAGTLPARKHGGTWYIAPGDLEVFRQMREGDPTSDVGLAAMEALMRRVFSEEIARYFEARRGMSDDVGSPR